MLALWHELNLDLSGGWRCLNTQMDSALALGKDVWRILMTSGFIFFCLLNIAFQHLLLNE